MRLILRKPQRALSLVLAMLSVITPIVQAASERSLTEPPREIFPITQIAEYQKEIANIPGEEGKARIDVVATPGAKGIAALAASDVRDLLLERYGKSIEILLSDDSAGEKSLLVETYLLSDLKGGQRSALFPSRFELKNWPEDGKRRDHAFAIRSYLGQPRPRIVVVGGSPQGIYYGLTALAQLIRFEIDHYTIRGANVLDWPAFSGRMTVLSTLVPTWDMPAAPNGDELCRSFVRRKTAIQRLTFSVHGYGPAFSDSLARGLVMGAGYWSSIYFDPRKIDPKLKVFNWSDPRVLDAWQDLARDEVKQSTMYIWHDGTDAGWWNKYLDQFWAQRDEVDRANYPDDPTPARADAVRFQKIVQAIREVRPGLPIMFTLPCYYDSPQNDQVQRVELFRDYLRTVGQAVPEDVYFILEQRAPEDVAGYAKYLKHPLVSYIYGGQEPGSTWGRDFKELGSFRGTCDNVMYGVSDCPDVLDTISAQYMWNPNVPATDEFIDNDLLPRACYVIAGPAWRELAEFILTDLEFKLMREDFNPVVLESNSKRIAHARQVLEEGLKKIPPTWPQAKFMFDYALTQVKDLDNATQQALVTANSEIDLSGATATASSTSKGDALSVLKNAGGFWQSDLGEDPHTFEVHLPHTFAINALAFVAPHENGYQLDKCSIEAWIGGSWMTVHQGNFKPVNTRIEIDPVKTDRVRLVVHSVYQYSTGEQSNLRNDAILTNVKLYGQPAQPDPEGTFSLDGKWHLRLDPDQTGIESKWPEATTFESGWTPAVVPGYWEGSGIDGSASFDGQGWYARQFQLPPSWRKHVIAIHFDAVDDEATVWINGQLVGSHTKADAPQDWFRHPFSFDISDKLHWDAPNTIVVRVNDIQLQGGIWKSVFLEKIAGPGMVNQE